MSMLATPETERFEFAGHGLRAVLIDGEAWFVATDAAAVLGYSAASAMTRTLDDDEKGMRTVHTLGGTQSVLVVSEPGLYSSIVRSRIPQAKEFRRWVTHEVLPAIRKTGSYSRTPALPQSYAEALRELASTVERNESLAIEVGQLTPRAEAWDELAAADGDYSVADAAKMLARAGVKTGPQRLFTELQAMRWTFRGRDGKWHAYADKVDDGYLAERPQSHEHPKTGEVVIDAPQVRLTMRGIERLRVRLGVLTAVPA